ncbi:MAG: serine hydrolase [Thermoflexaceae bacterium]|nr:serine hydrolase [Thermoflexaceae bacterium]
MRYSRGRWAGLMAAVAVLGGLLAALPLFVPGAAPAAHADGPTLGSTPKTPTPVRTPRITPTPRATRTPGPDGRRLVIPGVSGADQPPSPTATPAISRPLAPAPAMQGLRARLQAAIDSYAVGGTYAIAVTDLQTGEMVSVNGRQPQISGCVMNIFVLIAAMQDASWGAYPMSRVQTLIANTLWSSDAASARQLYGITGGGAILKGVQRVQSMADGLGLRDVFIDHPPGYPNESLGLDANNWVTAEDVNGMLAALYGGRLLDEPYRTQLLDAMTRVRPELNYLLGSGLTGLVSHKNGFLFEGGGWVDNDAGIVRFTRGGREYAYAVTFLAMDVDGYLGDVVLGQALTRMTWEHFSAAYP